MGVHFDSAFFIPRSAHPLGGGLISRINMLELREELVSMIKWEDADFECPRQTEIDAVAKRVLRMTDLLRKMREIAQRN